MCHRSRSVRRRLVRRRDALGDRIRPIQLFGRLRRNRLRHGSNTKNQMVVSLRSRLFGHHHGPAARWLLASISIWLLWWLLLFLQPCQIYLKKVNIRILGATPLVNVVQHKVSAFRKKGRDSLQHMIGGIVPIPVLKEGQSSRSQSSGEIMVSSSPP